MKGAKDMENEALAETEISRYRSKWLKLSNKLAGDGAGLSGRGVC